MAYKAILYEKKDNIAYVTLNRPEALNAINSQMRKELLEVFSIVKKDPDVRTVVISGAGERAFSVGADIKEFNTPAMEEGWEGWENLGILEKPVIAAIHGFCLGGALQMVLKCDIRIASEDAQFGLPEIGLGVMVYDGGTQRLSRLMGLTKTLEVVLTGERISAQEAYHFGLLNKVVSRQELMPSVEKMAKSIATKDPAMVMFYKDAVYRGYDLSTEAALRLERDLATIANSQRAHKKGNETK